MRFLTRSLIALFLAAVTVALLGWAAQITFAALEERQERDSPGAPARERVFSAEVISATPTIISPTLQAFGEVRAARTLELRAPAAGQVVELSDAFVEGGRVSEGDVLLRIDPADAEADLAVARADLAGAEAEARDAERTLVLAREELAGAEAQRDLQAQALARQRDLAQRGVGAAANVEGAELALAAAEQTILTRRGAIAQAEARIDAARLGIDRARIALAQAERALEDRVLRAEFDGVLADVTVLRGGLVTQNERLGELIDPRALEVAFRLSTTQYARIASGGDLRGTPVEAVLDVLGLEISAPGIVTREAAAVEEGRTGRLVFAALENAEGFRPGDFVRVEAEEPPLMQVVRLPASAVSSQNAVLVVGEGDRLEELPVEVLRRVSGDVLVAADGIAGREIVAARGPALGAGIRVRPLRPEAAADGPEQDEFVLLDPDRRARLIAFVEGGRMPEAVKARLLARLAEDRVPVRVVERIEGRMGG
ncbi:efflux RND transporter periplasmic adaptor subunit [Jannaschia aquimarina]|uniref:MdtN protein n=1 Tax=Jannaschia aquimarina TaxID=935700 RepID=A0A0D1CI87_9RHOB|nr:HlyD family efflux transporter periplasmic adaptor subunit [Jannaschia aquimarina]KIT14392.1 Multidrug resistance protein MdtN [Jannaschia aquimarina]SNS77834.1 Biotin-lipoyl like [Jannaschia aquimarina]